MCLLQVPEDFQRHLRIPRFFVVITRLADVPMRDGMLSEKSFSGTQGCSVIQNLGIKME